MMEVALTAQQDVVKLQLTAEIAETVQLIHLMKLVIMEQIMELSVYLIMIPAATGAIAIVKLKLNMMELVVITQSM